MASESHRLSILSDDEIEDLYGLPRFTDDDRQLYFDLNPAEKAAAGDIRTASVAAYLILELGYFKARRQFFAFKAHEVENDLLYILAAYFPGRTLVEKRTTFQADFIYPHIFKIILFWIAINQTIVMCVQATK